MSRGLGFRWRSGLAFWAVLLCAGSAAAGEWKPHAEVVLAPGSERLGAQLDFFLPLHQTQHGMFFANLRGAAQNRDVYGGGAGLGYRRLIADGRWIVGGYGFYDRRQSRYHNTLEQIVVGGEALSQGWDFRTNIYLPSQTKHLLRTRTRFAGAAVAQGNLILGPGTRTELNYERAMYGGDAEVGRAVPFFSNTRAYLAAYHFRTGAARNASGGRVRTETRLGRWLTLGSSVQYDNLRGWQGVAELRIRLSPFGRTRGRLERPLTRRMTDHVVRELGAFSTDEVKVVNTTASSLVQNGNSENLEIYYVNNTAGGGGDGTIENPYNTLAAAAAAAGEHDIIYVYEGDGTDTGQDAGITLQANQKLIGSGVALKAGGFTVLPKGNRPSITTGAGNTVTLANDVEVAGIDVTNAGAINGLVGSSVQNVYLRDNRLAGNLSAIALTNVTGSNRIEDNIFVGNTSGITFTVNGADTYTDLVSGNRFEGTGAGSGIIALTGGTATWNLTLSNNTVDNFTNGIVITGGVGITINLQASSNQVSRASLPFNLLFTGNTFLNAVFDGNTFTNNTAAGITLSNQVNTDTCIALRNNSSDTDYTINHTGALDLDYEDVNNTGTIALPGAGVENLVAEGTCVP